MNKTVKACAGLGGGGLIVGGGIVTEKYLSSNEEEGVSFVPAAAMTNPDEGGETVEQALKRMNLTLANNLSDFQKIFDDLKRDGLDSWATGIMSRNDISNGTRERTPSIMENKCKGIMNSKFSEFTVPGNNGKKNEWKTIKIICTTNYSTTDNARDYWGDDKTIYSESQTVDENRWKVQLNTFRNGDTKKTIQDMKKECVKLGSGPFRVSSRERSRFYSFCVINT